MRSAKSSLLQRGLPRGREVNNNIKGSGEPGSFCVIKGRRTGNNKAKDTSEGRMRIMSNVAFLLANEFEDSEMQVPYDEVKKAGHQADIVGLRAGETLKGKQGKAEYTADKGIGEVKADDYDAIVIPGGSSPENLRLDQGILKFVQQADAAGKTIAAICHGPQILASAGLLKGRTITSYPPLKDDMMNAGAEFRDEEVVVEGNYVTSRTPKDEPAFVRELLKKL